jgi:hypothetical protein
MNEKLVTQPIQPSNIKRIVVELTMSVEEARRVPYQGRKAQGPMGQLLDSKQLDYGDIAWEMTHAFNAKAREAARTLLAHWMGQPETIAATQRYGAEVVEGSEYLERNERFNLILSSFMAGMLVPLIFGFAYAFIQGFNERQIPQIAQGKIAAVIIADVIILLMMGVAFWFNYRQVKGVYDEYKNFRAGREGEEAVVERLRAALNNQWTIFRNLKLPNRKDDLDIVLVGPAGVWLLEVKAYKVIVRALGKQWEIQTKRGWKKLNSNPTIVTKRATELNDYLQRRGITRWIDCAIVMAEPQPISNFETSDTPIWLLPMVEDQVATLTTRTAPTEKEIEQIVSVLKELAAQQRAKEEARSKGWLPL